MTLAELTAMARSRADQTNSTFRSDAELALELNGAYQRLFAKIVEAHEDYLVAEKDLTLAAGTDSYDMSGYDPKVDKLRGVDVDDDGVWRPLKRFQWSQRGRFADDDGAIATLLRYTMRGGYLVFAAAPAAAFDIRIHYIPCAKTLTSSGTIVSVHDEIAKRGWDKWVAYQGAIFLLDAEQSDSRDLTLKCEAIEREIREHAANADAEQPEVATMRSTNGFYDEDVW